MVGIGLSEMSEKQLVEKANLALGPMEAGEENRPEVIKFVGVSIERGLGGMVFELNSTQSAGWLKEKETMANFLSNMGSTTDFKDQTYEVVMDWVLVTLEIGLAESWRAIKIASGLRPLAIKEVCWIKPIQL